MTWLHRLLDQAFPQATPEVDLHGLRVPEALSAVEAAMHRAEAHGLTKLRIVCGKGVGSLGGKGVPREAVAGWLDHHGYQGRYRRDVSSDGRDGALRVDLSPPDGSGNERS